MEILFALLAIVVITVGAVVLLKFPSYGTSDEPARDGPVTMVPEGRLRSEDVRSVRFPIVFRGYRPADVDALLDRLAEEMSAAETGPDQGGSDMITHVAAEGPATAMGGHAKPATEGLGTTDT